MLFEILDPKQKCKNIYSQNKIIANPPYEKLSQTWAYHPTLKDYDIKYASIYAQAKSLEECCPEDTRSEWEHVKKKYANDVVNDVSKLYGTHKSPFLSYLQNNVDYRSSESFLFSIINK